MKKQKPIELDFYEGLRMIRKASVPFSVKHIECSLENNQGGAPNWLEQVRLGPNRKNQYSDSLIGLQNTQGEIRQVYIHSILEIMLNTGEHYKLILNFQ